MNQEDRPTALCCHNLPDAEQVYIQAGQFGLRVPQDLSLVYFGGTWRPGSLAQHISCVGIDEAKLGLEAGRVLAEISTGRLPYDADHRVEIPVEFIPGETICPPS